jgi:hypothetical protein
MRSLLHVIAPYQIGLLNFSVIVHYGSLTRSDLQSSAPAVAKTG